MKRYATFLALGLLTACGGYDKYNAKNPRNELVGTVENEILTNTNNGCAQTYSIVVKGTDDNLYNATFGDDVPCEDKAYLDKIIDIDSDVSILYDRFQFNRVTGARDLFAIGYSDHDPPVVRLYDKN